MPQLKDFRKTKVISLPSFPDAKIEIYDSLLVGQMVGIDYSSKNVIEQIANALPAFIKSWNFTDEKEQPMEINRDNLNFLQLDDLQALSKEIMEFNAETKKKVNSSPS